MMSRARWQPVILILDKRLDCECGSMAVFINGKTVEVDDDCGFLNDVRAYCQDCWQAYIEEEEENEH